MLFTAVGKYVLEIENLVFFQDLEVVRVIPIFTPSAQGHPVRRVSMPEAAHSWQTSRNRLLKRQLL